MTFPESFSVMRIFKRFLILFIILAICSFVLIFCLRNTVQVDVDLFFVRFDKMPFDLVVISSFVFGGLLGLFSSLGFVYKMRKKYRLSVQKAVQEK